VIGRRARIERAAVLRRAQRAPMYERSRVGGDAIDHAAIRVEVRGAAQ
jgi:hypothetical protein